MAREQRERLLARHARRLAREELEDCYSQATLELLARVGRRAPFVSSTHIANALEQRLISRVCDHYRAIGGRSPIEAAFAGALSLGVGERECHGLIDWRSDVERTALLREELRRIARLSRELTSDQRLLLASHLSCPRTPAQFCAEHGWSLEKYRKVGQRARASLRRLLDEDRAAVPDGARRRIGIQGPTYDKHSPTA